MKSTPTPPNRNRICTACGVRRPITDFRRRSRASDKRHHQCNPCRNRRTQLNRAKKRNQGISEWATQVRRQQNVDAVAALVHLMLDRFHGLAAFADVWKAQIEAAPPGSKQALDGFRTMAHLWQLVSAASERNETDCAQLSDEQLQQAIEDSLAEMVNESDGVDEPEGVAESEVMGHGDEGIGS